MVRHLQRPGVLEKPRGRGQLDLDECRYAYIRWLRSPSQREGAPVDAGAIDPQLEQANYNRARREQQELQIAKARGEVFDIALAESLFARMGSEIAAILDALPAKLKRLSPSVTATNLDMMQREIARSRNAAADLVERFDDFVEEYYAPSTD